VDYGLVDQVMDIHATKLIKAAAAN